MKKIAGALLATMFLVTFGCVITTRHTIDAHITVDIRHIEEQAEDVLDYIEGQTDALPGIEAAAPEQSRLERAWETVAPITPVHAQELKTSSPLIRQIANSLRKRNPKICGLKHKGILGEDNRGYVALQSPDAFEDPEERNKVQRLIAEDNDDRKALYKELARINKDAKVSVTTIERIYANQHLKRAEPGQFVQLPPKGEHFDELKASPIGKKLADECVPGAWVKIK